MFSYQNLRVTAFSSTCVFEMALRRLVILSNDATTIIVALVRPSQLTDATDLDAIPCDSCDLNKLSAMQSVAKERFNFEQTS